MSKTKIILSIVILSISIGGLIIATMWDSLSVRDYTFELLAMGVLLVGSLFTFISVYYLNKH